MKKTYIAPLTEVVKINAVQLICQSIPKHGDFTPGEMTIAGKDDYEDFDDYDEDLW